MAEVLAILGAVTAAIQCLDTGRSLLQTGFDVCSRLRDIPDKIRRSLQQLQQLIDLIELVAKQSHNSLASPTTTVTQSGTVALSTITWLEDVIKDCTCQFRNLETILKRLLSKLEGKKGKVVWKSILTLKKEQTVTRLFDEIERHKSALNIWLGHSVSHQLHELHEKFDRLHEETLTLDDMALFREDFNRTSEKLVRDCCRDIEDRFKRQQNLDKTNYYGVEQQTYRECCWKLSNISVSQSQSRAIRHEIQNMRSELNRSKNLSSKVACNQRVSHVEPIDKSIRTVNSLQKSKSLSDEPCAWTQESSISASCSYCPKIRQLSLNIFGTNRLVLYHSILCKFCNNGQSRRVTCTLDIFSRIQLLGRVIDSSAHLVYSIRTLSSNFQFRFNTRVEKHYLEPFFRGLYGGILGRPIQWESYSTDKHNYLIKVTHKKLLEAFKSGFASPSDVDYLGRSLIQLQLDIFRALCPNSRQLGLGIIRLLISMGINPNNLDNRVRSAQEDIIKHYSGPLLNDMQDFCKDMFDWIGLRSHVSLNAFQVIKCMRCWPESKEELGYPHIGDIVLRKSKIDLKLFVSRGMKLSERGHGRLTPLHLATAANWPEGIKILIEGGADTSALDSLGCLPIDYAFETQSLQSIELLLDGSSLPLYVKSRNEWSCCWGYNMFKSLLLFNDNLDATVGLFTDHKQLLKDIVPYGDVMFKSSLSEGDFKMAQQLLLAVVDNIDQKNKYGETILMLACRLGLIDWIGFLLDNGADPSVSHGHCALKAGHILFGNYHHLNMWKPLRLERCVEIVEVAFDSSEAIESTCRCSPGGFTPVSALFRLETSSWGRRSTFVAYLSFSRWSTPMVADQVRAFILGEIFSRLEMTHSCISLQKPWKQMPLEDRVEIEDEEEELNLQLEESMEKFDSFRLDFDGSPLELLDGFLEELEQDLPSLDCVLTILNWSDQINLLGPGINYVKERVNFRGEKVLFGHKECLGEENMLSLLFGTSELDQ